MIYSMQNIWFGNACKEEFFFFPSIYVFSKYLQANNWAWTSESLIGPREITS